MELVLATRNQHKTREFRELLGREFKVCDLSAHESVRMPQETGATFAENAILKAVAVSQQLAGMEGCALRTSQRDVATLVIADDSGIEVDALNGAPGIFSARYAGRNASDQKNVDKLLHELKNATQRSARFRCVIAATQDGKQLGTFDGAVEGKIVDFPRGKNGFGYDPVFQPDGLKQTFAEMSAELKNKISHRAKAIAALRERLCEINR